jgi:hypothetical protein
MKANKKTFQAIFIAGALIFAFVVVAKSGGTPNVKQETPKVAAVQPQTNWVKIADFAGTNTDHTDLSTNAASDYFNLQTGKVKIVYTFSDTTAPYMDTWLLRDGQSISPYEQPQPYSFVATSNGEKTAQVKPGKYDVVVDSAGSFTIQVYEAH